MSEEHVKFIYKLSMTKSPTSVVEYPILPAARELILPLTTFITACSIEDAAFASPNVSSIIAQAQIAASGLITFLPVYFGALPPIG